MSDDKNSGIAKTRQGMYVTRPDVAAPDEEKARIYELEANRDDLRTIIQGCDARITELEAALELLVAGVETMNHPPESMAAYVNAARVLGKAEEQ